MSSTLLKQEDTPPSFDSDDKRWTAVATRDPAADGQFYYSVATTGVYCRPTCPSRLAKRENVRFFIARGDAETAGFRACKRCKPDQPSLAQRYAGMVAQACQLIEASDAPPDLETLAQAAGMSRFHFHRVFKAIVGVTPKAYAVAQRNRRVREKLQQHATITSAIYDAGFNSNGRFYATSNQLLGMKPSAFRSGGRNADIRFAVGQCSLGAVLVAATDKGVCAILLGDDPEYLVRDLQHRFPHANLTADDPDFEKSVAQVVGFIDKPTAEFSLPLDIRGTAFQQRVWQALRAIPPGATVSYTELARRVGAPKAVRAVASACAANAIAVAIPCHRVVRNDNSISGYRWGVARKQMLLAKETLHINTADQNER